MNFICYSNCSTCKRAEKWLSDQAFTFEKRDIKTNNPTKEELMEWHRKSGLPLRRFFNTSGMIYREMSLSKKLSSMAEEEQYDLLATDGMLVKRPILVDGEKVLVGFKEDQWKETLKG